MIVKGKDAIKGFQSIHICYPEIKSCEWIYYEFKVAGYTIFKVYDNASDNSMK